MSIRLDTVKTGHYFVSDGMAEALGAGNADCPRHDLGHAQTSLRGTWERGVLRDVQLILVTRWL